MRTPLLGAGARHDKRPSEASCCPILDMVPNLAECRQAVYVCRLSRRSVVRLGRRSRVGLTVQETPGKVNMGEKKAGTPWTAVATRDVRDGNDRDVCAGGGTQGTAGAGSSCTQDCSIFAVTA